MTAVSERARTDGAARAMQDRPDGWFLSRKSGLVLAGAAALGGIAAYDAMRSRRAERRHPPAGRFIHVDGVRLHVVERGSGTPLILLHGNGSAVQDFATSGLIDAAAEKHRVVAFDRPGFGHSSRPRGTVWAPAAQADLIHDAALQLGLRRYLVLGHSWGALVALQMGLRHPESVAGLVLVSGYYFPTSRFDALLAALPALPVLGDLARHTVLPLVNRLLWPAVMNKIFAPAPVSPDFSRAIKELALRPSQLRAAAAESGLMLPAAAAAEKHYRQLSVPVGIIAGAADRLLTTAGQSERLARTVTTVLVRSVPGAGHMVHHSALDAVMETVDRVGRAASLSP